MSSVHCGKVKTTILTPTYNRAYTLSRLYDSLMRQKDKRFVWLIVDDGSDDNTKEIVDRFKQHDFLIRYIYKGNGGKHTAINWGVGFIETDYTFVVDSDDFLTDNAMELINHWVDEIEGLPEFAGVAGTRVKDDKANSIIGQFPVACEYIDCLNSERKQKKLLGDKAEVYKTELLKQNPFPEYKNEKFIPESVVWNKFSLMGLKVRWHKEGIVVCTYLEDGLTCATKKMSHFEKNFWGYRDDYKLRLKVMKFPYNYLAGSVFCAKCYALGKGKKCLDDFKLSIFGKALIKILGIIRYQLGRY